MTVHTVNIKQSLNLDSDNLVEDGVERVHQEINLIQSLKYGDLFYDLSLISVPPPIIVYPTAPITDIVGYTGTHYTNRVKRPLYNNHIFDLDELGKILYNCMLTKNGIVHNDVIKISHFLSIKHGISSNNDPPFVSTPTNKEYVYEPNTDTDPYIQSFGLDIIESIMKWILDLQNSFNEELEEEPEDEIEFYSVKGSVLSVQNITPKDFYNNELDLVNPESRDLYRSHINFKDYIIQLRSALTKIFSRIGITDPYYTSLYNSDLAASYFPKKENKYITSVPNLGGAILVKDVKYVTGGVSKNLGHLTDIQELGKYGKLLSYDLMELIPKSFAYSSNYSIPNYSLPFTSGLEIVYNLSLFLYRNSTLFAESSPLLVSRFTNAARFFCDVCGLGLNNSIHTNIFTLGYHTFSNALDGTPVYDSSFFPLDTLTYTTTDSTSGEEVKTSVVYNVSFQDFIDREESLGDDSVENILLDEANLQNDKFIYRAPDPFNFYLLGFSNTITYQYNSVTDPLFSIGIRNRVLSSLNFSHIKERLSLVPIEGLNVKEKFGVSLDLEKQLKTSIAYSTEFEITDDSSHPDLFIKICPEFTYKIYLIVITDNSSFIKNGDFSEIDFTTSMTNQMRFYPKSPWNAPNIENLSYPPVLSSGTDSRLNDASFFSTYSFRDPNFIEYSLNNFSTTTTEKVVPKFTQLLETARSSVGNMNCVEMLNLNRDYFFGPESDFIDSNGFRNGTGQFYKDTNSLINLFNQKGTMLLKYEVLDFEQSLEDLQIFKVGNRAAELSEDYLIDPEFYVKTNNLNLSASNTVNFEVFPVNTVNYHLEVERPVANILGFSIPVKRPVGFINGFTA